MTETDYASKLDEVDRLLNDPDVPMEASRVWSILAELSGAETSPAGALPSFSEGDRAWRQSGTRGSPAGQ